MAKYQPRLVDELIRQMLLDLPALLVVGPRATGKTTTATRHARTVVRLDREAEAVAFRADPDAALRGLPEPVLLDEWQVVPSVLGAIKRAVDTRPDPGRFIVTGSVRGDLEGELWPGTGRLTRIAMYGMTIREQSGGIGAAPFLDRVLMGDELQPAIDSPDLRGYIEVILRSGFPEPALRLTERSRQRWLDSYVDQLLTRDADQVDGGRDPARLRRYVEAYAVNTAGVVDDKTLYDAAGINRKTALAYERLLTNLLVVEAMPAWTSNRLKRLVLSPKRYLVDPALVAAILRLDANAILRSGEILGRLLDTFVASQLRAEIAVSASRPRLYHVRQEQGRFEVDVLAELAGGQLVAVEVKASSAPTADDARHLMGLRDRAGEAFVAGIVFHTGPRTYALAEKIVAAPISALWAVSAAHRA
ncbi:MAG: ATP-binding protein [Chloroflexi bacterium]|nr:ATP-binding protein [Chloroflexota bacterium]